MTDDEEEPCSGKVISVPSKEVTVPDATHPRFRKPMCRCTEEIHGTFALKALHNHFTKWKHKSVSSCSYCGSNEVYEYYFTMDRLNMRIYHDCSRQQANHSAEPVREEERSVTQPISENCDVSDIESSGIGTGYNSTVSIFNGQSDDGQSTSSSSRQSFSLLSKLTSVQNETSNGS